MKIAGCGCALADFLYAEVDFGAQAIAPYMSRESGDGGIAPELVFLEDFERHVGKRYTEVLQEVLGNRSNDAFNVGGPSIVALVLAAQLLYDENISVGFYGALGDDNIAQRIRAMLNQTPLDISHLDTRPGITPFTLVLNDPRYDNGQGERAFINNIGAAGNYLSTQLPDSFFEADITLFGATALVPGLHNDLTALLKKAKIHNCSTVVTTVYDFCNEQTNPGGQWPLGDSHEGWPLIDLFIADVEEALRLSGTDNIESACQFIIEQGCGAFAITHGPNPVRFYSRGKVFAACELSELPISEEVGKRLSQVVKPHGDTTGCGDNFAGGVIASLAVQAKQADPSMKLSLPDAVALGVVCGGSACFQLGGIILENHPGQKTEAISELLKTYSQQVAQKQQIAPCLFK